MIKTCEGLIPGKIYKLHKSYLPFQLYRYQLFDEVNNFLCKWPDVEESIELELGRPFLVLEKTEIPAKILSQVSIVFIKVLIENENIWWMETDDEYFEDGKYKFKEIK